MLVLAVLVVVWLMTGTKGARGVRVRGPSLLTGPTGPVARDGAPGREEVARNRNVDITTARQLKVHKRGQQQEEAGRETHQIFQGARIHHQ